MIVLSQAHLFKHSPWHICDTFIYHILHTRDSGQGDKEEFCKGFVSQKEKLKSLVPIHPPPANADVDTSDAYRDHICPQSDFCMTHTVLSVRITLLHSQALRKET